MSDFLIAPDAGQGAWFWGRVWGLLTAPVEHPPRLYRASNDRQCLVLNLPGHGADAAGDTGEVRLEECVQAVVQGVERRQLKSPTLVGHGLGGLPVLLAVPRLATPPKRVVLVAGMTPGEDRTPLSRYPQKIQRRLDLGLQLGKVLGRELRLPPSFIAKYLCNGMAAGEVAAALGFFGPLPSRVLETKAALESREMPCPVSYIVLEQDLLLRPEAQWRMARQIPDVEVIHLDSCHQASLHKPRELADILLGLG